MPIKTAQTSGANTFNENVEMISALNEDENSTNSAATNANMMTQSNVHQFQLGHDDESIHQTYLAMAQMHSNTMSSTENLINEQGMVSFRKWNLILFAFHLFLWVYFFFF